MEKEKTMPQTRRVTRKKVVATEPASNEAGQFSPEMRHKMIEDAAYDHYQRRASGNGGDHVEDWLQAEAEIEAMLNATGNPI